MANKQDSGLHLLGDLFDISQNVDLMTNGSALEEKFKQIVNDSTLTPLHSHFHEFENGGGVTGVIVLAESHVAVHCWPEINFASIDVYVCKFNQCNRVKAQYVFDKIIELFHPGKIVKHRVDRK